jgi:RNA recognition motif-containing protein
MSAKMYKIFVGNVPFQCSNQEFIDCFKDIDGFIDGEIINRHNTEYSRGFGFITLETEDAGKKLMARTDIICKDRVLRFADYNFGEKSQTDKNYIFIKNIPRHMKRNDLIDIFSKYGDIGACFILTNTKTGISKGNGIIEIKDNEIYKWKNNFIVKTNKCKNANNKNITLDSNNSDNSDNSENEDERTNFMRNFIINKNKQQ